MFSLSIMLSSKFYEVDLYPLIQATPVSFTSNQNLILSNLSFYLPLPFLTNHSLVIKISMEDRLNFTHLGKKPVGIDHNK